MLCELFAFQLGSSSSSSSSRLTTVQDAEKHRVGQHQGSCAKFSILAWTVSSSPEEVAFEWPTSAQRVPLLVREGRRLSLLGGHCVVFQPVR